MKLIIDRSKWYRGFGGNGSRLRRRSDGKQCCLGFLGAACGVQVEKLIDVEYPVGPVNTFSGRAAAEWPAWLFERSEDAKRERGSDNSSVLAIINDRVGVSDADREARIAEIFAQHGVEVEFIDGEPS